MNRRKSLARMAILVGWAAGLLWWEHKRALRRVTQSKLERDTRNLAVAGLAAGAMQFLELPVALALIRRSRGRKRGLLSIVRLADSAKLTLAVLLLDYTLYIWHRLTHRVPFLWRFHQVHHADREMDASTALRFHFGEITLSVAFRAAQVFLIGPTLAAYGVWQMFLFLCILFHHANISLPLSWERRVAMVLVTPRLHGIHHSVRPDEMNANWSSGFTIWDWLHGTLRTAVPQDAIVIGVAALRNDQYQTLRHAITLPFRRDVIAVSPPGQRVREPASMLRE